MTQGIGYSQKILVENILYIKILDIYGNFIAAITVLSLSAIAQRGYPFAIKVTITNHCLKETHSGWMEIVNLMRTLRGYPFLVNSLAAKVYYIRSLK